MDDACADDVVVKIAVRAMGIDTVSRLTEDTQ